MRVIDINHSHFKMQKYNDMSKIIFFETGPINVILRNIFIFLVA